MKTSALEVVVEEAAKTNFVAVAEAEGRAPACIGMSHRRIGRNGVRTVAGEEVVAAGRLNTMAVVADIGDCLHMEIHHHTGDWKEVDYFATIVVDVGSVVEENVVVL
jgi:hypothetical protein